FPTRRSSDLRPDGRVVVIVVVGSRRGRVVDMIGPARFGVVATFEVPVDIDDRFGAARVSGSMLGRSTGLVRSAVLGAGRDSGCRGGRRRLGRAAWRGRRIG